MKRSKKKRSTVKVVPLDRQLLNESLTILGRYRLFIQSAMGLLVVTLDGLSRAKHSHCQFCLEPEGSHTAVCPIHDMREALEKLQQIKTW